MAERGAAGTEFCERNSALWDFADGSKGHRADCQILSYNAAEMGD